MIQLQKFASEGLNAEVQLAKLERMKQYTDALSCRRKLLLSYFGELVAENCGNCDICKNPPAFFDGTLIAQKALSAIKRLNESEPIGVIIDFLRGSKNAYIYEKEYQNLKTYNIGNAISWFDWNQYLIQLINLGYCEIAFQEQNRIKLTDFAKKVLFEGEKVRLTTVQKMNFKIEKAKDIKTKSITNSLFETLRKLRAEIAKEEGVPAYVIFNDATLRQLETERPMSESDFLNIDGVGNAKLEKYGAAFIDAIMAFHKDKPKNKEIGSSYKESLAMYNDGHSIDEIAKKRNLAPTTIISHLTKLYRDGLAIDWSSYLTNGDIEKIRLAKATLILATPFALKPYFDHFEGQISYEKIRIGLAIIEKESNL